MVCICWFGAVRAQMCSGYVYLQAGPPSGRFVLHLLVVIFVSSPGGGVTLRQKSFRLSILKDGTAYFYW